LHSESDTIAVIRGIAAAAIACRRGPAFISRGANDHDVLASSKGQNSDILARDEDESASRRGLIYRSVALAHAMFPRFYNEKSLIVFRASREIASIRGPSENSKRAKAQGVLARCLLGNAESRARDFGEIAVISGL